MTGIMKFLNRYTLVTSHGTYFKRMNKGLGLVEGVGVLWWTRAFVNFLLILEELKGYTMILSSIISI
jgi:hypothetical protein